MLRRSVSVLAVSLAFMVIIPASAVSQDGHALSGVWYLEKVRVDDQVDSSPQPGMFFFQDGYLAFVDVQASSPRTFSEPDAPTPEEKAAAYDGFAALAGQYEVRNDTLFGSAYVSLAPSLMREWPENTEAVATVRVEGDRASFDLIGNPMVVTFRRLNGTSLPR